MRNILILALIACTVLPLAAAPPAAKSQPANVEGRLMDRMVLMDIKDMPLEQALGMLLKPAKVSYRVDPEVANLKVTAVLKGVSADLAVQEVVKAAGATMKTENGVLHVMARPAIQNSRTIELERKLIELRAQLAVALRNKTEKSPEVGDLKVQIEVLEELLAAERKSAAQYMAAVDAAMTTATARNQPQPAVTRIFTIRYINPAELVPLIYALGARQVTVVSGGKLVVNAPESVLQQAAEIVRELDTEEALPRPVRVQVMTSYQITDKSGAREMLNARTEGTIPDGQPIGLHVVAVPENEKLTESLILDVMLTPQIGPANQITLTGNTSLTTMLGMPQSALSNSPVAVSVTSGKPQVIASGTLNLVGGKLEFEVTAIATIGEGRLRTKTGTGGGGGFNVPGIGNFGGFGGGGGSFGAAMGEAANEWKNAFGGGGSLGAAMNEAAAQLKNAFGGQNLDLCPSDASDPKVPSGQDTDATDASSGGGGGH